MYGAQRAPVGPQPRRPLTAAAPSACRAAVAQVSKTISQMVMFIKQEAEEKAAEIAVSAEEEFNITKLQVGRPRRGWRRHMAAAAVQVGQSGAPVAAAQRGCCRTALFGTACLKVCRRSAHASQLLEAEKARVRREFERREAAIEVKKKVGVCCSAVSSGTTAVVWVVGTAVQLTGTGRHCC